MGVMKTTQNASKCLQTIRFGILFAWKTSNGRNAVNVQLIQKYLQVLQKMYSDVWVNILFHKQEHVWLVSLEIKKNRKMRYSNMLQV